MATTPKWWIFSLLCAVLISAPALAGRKSKPEPVITPAPVAPAAPQDPGLERLFANLSDGVRIGDQPAGLASLSAQSCNACHVGTHQSWLQSAHGSRAPSDAFLQAAREIGEDSCQACHQPMVVQRPNLLTFDRGDVNRPITQPNPNFNASLHSEGVTCVACHVRDGKMVGTAPNPTPPAVHPNLTWSADLTTSEGCAGCHQLTWRGATSPLYDTFGEWQRSPQAAAGVQCQDCHLGAGSESSPGSNHNINVDPARAVTVLVDFGSAPVIRGGSALDVQIRVLNTGAGHAFPTGSPWKTVQLEVLFEREAEDGPDQIVLSTQALGRTLSESAPWELTDDTRIQAGGQLEFAVTGALPQDAEVGPWWLVIRFTEEIRGVRAEQPLIERRHRLRVE